ncbi:MAG: SMC-Scp complex subunit ScpB [Candidatus Thalassarchaeaceae archaeon]|jgi:segregation and condensation protein B|nr:SMC-Scp complex subunit ScpB [Candidatus Thalassarchaeaceae archaeon]
MSEPGADAIVEALLFCSGRSLSCAELSSQSSKSENEILGALEALRGQYRRRRGNALQIVEVGGRWSMEVDPRLSSYLPSELRGDIPDRLQRAAALIAYHQPMMQSDLVSMMGPIAYDYVRSLARLGLVDRRRKGNSRRLQTTRYFAERFQCPHTEPKKVKEWFRQQAESNGITSQTLVDSIRELDPQVGDMDVVPDSDGTEEDIEDQD